MSIKLPVIGDEVLSPHDKFTDANGDQLFDQLVEDGSEVIEAEHPLLFTYLGGVAPVYLPTVASPTTQMPYRIIGDLT